MVVHNPVSSTAPLNPLSSQTGATSRKRRFLQYLTIMGPGLIVMMGDNDAGAFDTYGQAGQNYGLSLLWVLLLLLPVLIVNQEMVVRLGAVTGVGHAKLIFRRFGFWWGLFSAGDLFLLNFLTIVTEFIGISFFADYFHFSRKVVIILAMVILITIVTTGSFFRWEKVMFAFVGLAVILIPIMLFMSKPNFGDIGYHLVVPSILGGLNNDSILLIIAMVGTTVAPWQLFFQQSSVVDKSIKSKHIKLSRWDTYIGAVVLLIGAIAMVVTPNYAAEVTHSVGSFLDSDKVGQLLHGINPVLGDIFGIILLDVSIIGAAAISLSSSYAYGDVFGISHSLNKKFSEAKSFYISYDVMIILSGFIVLIPDAPLTLINTLVQALAGLLLPSASVFLLLLCNDRGVLGPWVNKKWVNLIAIVIIVVLLDLSAILMINTIFPKFSVITVASTVAIVSAVLCIIAALGFIFKMRISAKEVKAMIDFGDKLEWHMPPIDELEPAHWTYGTKLAMYALRGYLILGAILLIIKGFQLAS